MYIYIYIWFLLVLTVPWWSWTPSTPPGEEEAQEKDRRRIERALAKAAAEKKLPHAEAPAEAPAEALETPVEPIETAAEIQDLRSRMRTTRDLSNRHDVFFFLISKQCRMNLLNVFGEVCWTILWIQHFSLRLASFSYSRRFATATARTASLGSRS